MGAAHADVCRFGSLSVIYFILGTCYFLGVSGWPMLLLVVFGDCLLCDVLAPVVWVVLSEIFPVRIRGMAMALSTFFLWVACFLLTYTFPILNEAVGASGTFWLYAGSVWPVSSLYGLNSLKPRARHWKNWKKN